MVFKVHEHNTELKNVEQEGSQENYSFKDMLRCVTTNKYIMVYFLAVIVSTIFGTRAAVESFLGFYIFNDSMIFTYIMLIGFIPGIILSGFCGKIADKVGNLYITSPVVVYCAEHFEIRRLCDRDRSNAVGNRYVSELIDQLLQEGRLVSAETASGAGIRAATAKELKDYRQPVEQVNGQITMMF